MRSARRTKMWIAALAAGAAAVLLVPGVASACQVPASAEVACAPDLHHWEATITVSNVGPSTFTITSASLDTTAWSAEAALTGLAPGTAIAAGGHVTARATGIPLSTAGATITYAGHWADATAETWTYTLGRPVTSCEEVTTTTGATTSTTEAPSSIATTTATTAGTTTTATTVPGTTPDNTPTTSVPPLSIPGKVVTTPPASVLDESVSSTAPALPTTGAGAVGQLAFGAFLLVLVGIGLVAIGLSGSEGSTHRHHR